MPTGEAELKAFSGAHGSRRESSRGRGLVRAARPGQGWESTVRALIDAAVQAAGALNSADMRLELAIPPVVTAVAPIVVGVPAQTALPIDRPEPDIIAWK